MLRNGHGEAQDRKEIFEIPVEFVDFGFELDIKGGASWPFSGIFWTADRGKAKKIHIDVGTASNARIKIEVNDQEVFNDSDRNGHIRYNWDVEDKIMVRTYKTGAYANNAQRFYARKSSTAKWDLIINETNGNHSQHIDPDYVEFGFEFDIMSGTDWPYSGVFWTANKSEELKSKGGKVEDIQIDMTGTVRYSDIYIHVNGENIVSHEHCDTHLRYDWSSRSDIRVNIRKPGWYALNCSNLYARKPGGTWEKVYNNDKDSPFTISNEYVEFGFEFDITWGTDWPYSNVFWTEKKSESMRVNTIDICMGGAVRNSYITIHVNGNPVVDVTNCDSHNQYPWGI